MAVSVAAVLAIAATYGPLVQKMFNLGITVGKTIAAGKDEMDDVDWAVHVAEGEQLGLDFRKLVGRAPP